MTTRKTWSSTAALGTLLWAAACQPDALHPRDGTDLDALARAPQAADPFDGFWHAEEFGAEGTEDATNLLQSHVIAFNLKMGDTLQLTTCPDLTPLADHRGDTVLRVLDAGATRVLEVNDDFCGVGERGSVVTVASGADQTVLAAVGCYAGQSCEGMVAYRIAFDHNGLARGLEDSFRALPTTRTSLGYVSDGMNMPDAYPFVGETGLSHAQSITRLPQYGDVFFGQDFFVNFSHDGDGGGVGYYLDNHDLPPEETQAGTGQAKWDERNVWAVGTRPDMTGLGALGLDHPGGSQRFGRYWATAVMCQTWDCGHSVFVYDLSDVPDAPLRSVDMWMGGTGIFGPAFGYGYTNFTGITKLKGEDYTYDPVFGTYAWGIPAAGSLLLVVQRDNMMIREELPDSNMLDFYLLPADETGWVDVETAVPFHLDTVHIDTQVRNDIDGHNDLNAQNGTLFTGPDGSVYLIAMAGGTNEDIAALYSITFAGQRGCNPATGLSTKYDKVCIEKVARRFTDQTAGSGGDEWGLNPQQAMKGSGGAYLLRPRGEEVVLYTSEWGDNGDHEFMIYEWAN